MNRNETKRERRFVRKKARRRIVMKKRHVMCCWREIIIIIEKVVTMISLLSIFAMKALSPHWKAAVCWYENFFLPSSLEDGDLLLCTWCDGWPLSPRRKSSPAGLSPYTPKTPLSAANHVSPYSILSGPEAAGHDDDDYWLMFCLRLSSRRSAYLLRQNWCTLDLCFWIFHHNFFLLLFTLSPFNTI